MMTRYYNYLQLVFRFFCHKVEKPTVLLKQRFKLTYILNKKILFFVIFRTSKYLRVVSSIIRAENDLMTKILSEGANY